MELKRIAHEMRPLIYQAGHIAMQHFRNVAVERKKDKSYVTAADREIEEFLQSEIHMLYPDHGFFGEESGHHRMDEAEFVWAIDPIDGTAPFIFELPVWGISVGLIHEKRMLIGFVYLPVLDELYWAIDGEPAYMNNQTIQVANPIEMKKGTAIVASSALFRRYEVTYSGRALSFGSAAAHICLGARGKIQGGIQETVRLYDIAASAVILKSAGGTMKYLSGREVDLWELVDGRKTPEAFVFGHPHNVDQLVTMFKSLEEDNGLW